MAHLMLSRYGRALFVSSLILVGTLGGPVYAETEYVAAVLHAGLPGEDAQVVAMLSQCLGDAGYRVVEFDADALCDPAGLNPETVDLLALPNSAVLPEASVVPITKYLEGGGDIIALNAPMWQTLLIKPRGEWLSRDDYERQTATEPPEHALFHFNPEDIAGWQRGYFPEDSRATYETVDEGPVPGRRSLHAKIEDLRNWDNFGPKDLDKPFPEGDTLTVFAAKGGPKTRNLAVEWSEQDGSRWIATVPLSTEWRRYVLTPEDFKFWESVPARQGTVFQPANAKSMNIGLAFTHTGTASGEHEFWVSGFGTASVKPDNQDLLAKPVIPALDSLSPGYKFFRSTASTRISTAVPMAIMSDFKSVPELTCIQPRPNGAGFGKGRSWRWVPLLEAYRGAREWCGSPASLTIHADGRFRGGQWAAFTMADADWFMHLSAGERVVRFVAADMRYEPRVMDAGTGFYTYFLEQPIELGIRLANLTRDSIHDISAFLWVRDVDTRTIVFEKRWPVVIDAGAQATLREIWSPPYCPKSGFEVLASFDPNGADSPRMSDVIHRVHIWQPKEKKSFITIENGDFMLDGKRWRAHGVNYMPSSGIGAEDNEYFERWLSAQSYDPEIIHRDLEHVKDLGLNSVSIFEYDKEIGSQNLLDFLRQADELGLKVNLSLRPGTIGDFNWLGMQSIIEYYKLWEHDEIFAYDIDWEPMWWQHEKRVKWDREWESWIVERYGSIDNAEKDWGMSVPRDKDGAVTNPEDKQLMTDGDWRIMVAAYRRFLDTLLYREYSGIRAKIRAIDPNHFVSFRMTEAGDPTMNWGGVLPYDFPYLAAAVDILEPEGYGRIGDWEKIKPAWFEYEYARWAAPEKPMFWAEAGVHAWDVAAGKATPELLERQGQFYRDFYRMLISSGADGIFWWWYPGGFRVGENSDYGIINCDGSDRPNSKAIRENAAAFIDGPSAKPVDHWIEFDRDKNARGITGVYDEVQGEFWKAIEDGKTPGLRTAGTGTDSSNCPALAVGNVPWNGTNPPKFLDGFFDTFEIQDRNGHWVSATKGGRIEVAGDKPVLARMTIANLGEAAWLHEGNGAVYVAAGDTRIPLPSDVPHLDRATLDCVVLAPAGLKDATQIAVRLVADGRTPFGERYEITLAP